jgi:uncharacterized protein YecE (DUF72 family)
MVAKPLKQPKPRHPDLRIGTAGWSIPRQFAEDFPANGTHLERYAAVLPCAEINSSFYRPHRVSTWAKWAASVPENFRFSVKAPKTITHEARLACTPEDLKAFLAEVTTLGPKLGPILVQLPPSLAFESATAKTFFSMLRDLHQGPIVFEPRHATWFTAEADDLLKDLHIARVAADPAPVPEAATPGGWNKLIYYRLHGSPRMYYSPYTQAFLNSLADSIAQQQQASTVWCIFDNTASGAALGDANTLRNLLHTKIPTANSA